MIILSRAIIPLFLLLACSAIYSANSSITSCIDINTATKEELLKIKHIGEVRAEQIIKLREEKLFSSIDDLDIIIGISPSRISDIKEEGLACVMSENTKTEDIPLLPPPPVVEAKPQQTYPTGIVINEILPSPEGADTEKEWIEIYNQNNFEVNVSDWKISDISGRTKIYIFPNEIKIPAKGFFILPVNVSGITLNNGGDGLKLLYPDDKIADEIKYDKAIAGESYIRVNDNWFWSSVLTPGSENIASNKIAEKQLEENNQATSVSEKQNYLAKINPEEKIAFNTIIFATFLSIVSGIAILLLKKNLN